MIHRYEQSEEFYKGYKLVLCMTSLTDRLQYHRSCEVYKDNERIAIGKTKKECKDLIDGGYMK